MSTIAVDQITDSSGGNTVTINGATPTQYNTIGRNRIINGDMRIDQRNAGAAVTVDNTVVYTLDRYRAVDTTSGAFSVQQDSIAPSGFVNSLKVTITTADASLTTGESALIQQRIEGTNISDLAWGTANAKTVTLSFWVRSSLTGTFGGSLKNSASDRSYPFTYTISVSDTWEYKTVEIEGDTSGTWLTTNQTGIDLIFSLGSPADRIGTAGAWNSNNNTGATGQTNLIATNGATWYITGIQLEVGSVATEFEHRPYGQELLLCQRYLWRKSGSLYDHICLGTRQNTTSFWAPCPLPCDLRANPTVTYANLGIWYDTAGSWSTTNSSLGKYGSYSGNIYPFSLNGISTSVGTGILAFQNNGYIQLDAEL